MPKPGTEPLPRTWTERRAGQPPPPQGNGGRCPSKSPTAGTKMTPKRGDDPLIADRHPHILFDKAQLAFMVVDGA